MTTIGVAIAVFNGSATIDAALASIAGQTRQPEQVVVVDDGSTDRTAEVVETWRQVLPLVLVRHPENEGLAAARTTGTNRLDTELVAAIDADDVWLPHHLEVMERAYAQQPGIVTPIAVEWNPDREPAVDWGRRFQREPRCVDLEHLLVMNWLFSGSMYSRAAYERVGAVHRFSGCDDWDLWIRLVAAGEIVVSTSEPTVLYRVHASSMSADDRLLDREIEVLEAALSEHSTPSVVAAAQRGLRHRHARVALLAAYEAARSDRPWAARRFASRTFLGPSSVRIRGAAMLLAPRSTTSRRDAIRRPVGQ